MLARTIRIRSSFLWRSYSSKADEYGIPLNPTWSVTKLLSSYPQPTVSSQTLTRLHELAALLPPPEDAPEHARLKEEMSELVRLVEAVKLVDTRDVSVTTRWDREDADRPDVDVPPKDIPTGQDLLQHAARTKNRFYLVDTGRNRTVS